MIDVFFDLLILTIAISGLYVFTTNESIQKVFVPYQENEIYLNHIFSNPACLALKRDNIVYPYKINIINTEPELKEKSNSDNICLKYPDKYSMFTAQIIIKPAIAKEFTEKTYYYDEQLFNKWRPIAQSEENQIKSGLILINSKRLITLIDGSKEFLGIAEITTIIPK